MTHELYTKCLIASKIISASKEYKASNIPFSIGRYIKDDKLVLISDLVFSLAAIYFVDEWMNLTPWFLEKAKTLFLFVGFTGSYFLNMMLSVSKQKFLKYVDQTSDVAEGKKDSSALEKPNQDLGIKQELKQQPK